MMSFQISLTPSRRAAARYVTLVRRAIQKALAEEREASGLTQTDIARKIGVHRSVINREINGYKDLTLGRVAELAWAMGRRPCFSLAPATASIGSSLASFAIQQTPVTAGTMAGLANTLATSSTTAGITLSGGLNFAHIPHHGMAFGSISANAPLEIRAA